jgi:hypothetical protein
MDATDRKDNRLLSSLVDLKLNGKTESAADEVIAPL